MTADHVFDILLQGLAAGFFGVLALLAFLVLRRRWQDRSTLTALPVGSAEAVGAILAFFVAAVGVAIWLDLETVQRGQGAGQPLSIAIAAICAAAFFGVRLYRSVKLRAA